MEQFIPFCKADSHYITPRGEVNYKHVVYFIQKYMLPTKHAHRVYKHISVVKQQRHEMNPIKYYFQNNRAPLTLHYVISLETFGVVPPKDRQADVLPFLWKQFIYPNLENQKVG